MSSVVLSSDFMNRRHRGGAWLQRGLRVGLLAVGLSLPGLALAEPPWLGLELEPSPQGGAKIVDVYPGSPLYGLLGTSQLASGDVVVALDGHKVAEPKDLAAQVRAQKPGQTVTLKLRRASGQLADVSTVLLSRPSEDQLTQMSMQLEEERQKRLIGQHAPDFGLEQLHGAKLPGTGTGLLAASKGQPVLLVFFASWCGPCLREIPHLNDLQARRPDLRMIALSTEANDKILDIVRRYSPAYAVGRDIERKAYRAYGVASYPTSFLMDGAGIVRAVDHGSLTTVEQALDKIPKAVKAAR